MKTTGLAIVIAIAAAHYDRLWLFAIAIAIAGLELFE